MGIQFKTIRINNTGSLHFKDLERRIILPIIILGLRISMHHTEAVRFRERHPTKIMIPHNRVKPNLMIRQMCQQKVSQDWNHWWTRSQPLLRMTAECFLGLEMAVIPPHRDLLAPIAPDSTMEAEATFPPHIQGHSMRVAKDLLGPEILQAVTASPQTSLQVQIMATQW